MAYVRLQLNLLPAPMRASTPLAGLPLPPLSVRTLWVTPIRVNASKIENRWTFETGNYHEFLIPETIKLLGSTKNKITKDKNGESVSHLEITETILIHCNIIINDYQDDSRVLINHLLNYHILQKKPHIFRDI